MDIEYNGRTYRFTNNELVNEVCKEIGYRKGVYPRLVQKGTMAGVDADRRIALMHAVRQSLVATEQPGLTGL